MSGKRASVGYFVLVLAVFLALLGCRRTPAPTPIVIDTFPAEIISNDTFLTLIDADGNPLAADDNSSPVTGFARIVLASGLGSGTYYIKVSKPDDTGNPNYGIRVLDFDPGDSYPAITGADEDESLAELNHIDDAVDVDGVPTSPWAIALGEIVSRSIYPEPPDVDFDVDWYKLVLP